MSHKICAYLPFLVLAAAAGIGAYHVYVYW